MEKTNRELLEQVIEDRLTKSLDDANNTDAFEEAMKAIAKQNDIDKHIHELEKHSINVEKFEHEVFMDKMKHDHEVMLEKLRHELDAQKLKQETKKDKRDTIMKVVEIGAIVVAAPLIEAGCRKAFAELLCNFEKDYTFTTTAGRSLSSLFRFK